MKATRLVLISDTHLHHPDVPDGDVLIHAGDMTLRGTLPQLESEAKWLRSLPHSEKVVIAGNHDWGLYREETRRGAEALLRQHGLTYLCDSACRVGDVLFYGTPWTPWFCGWAFMEFEDDLAKRSDAISECDVLISHGPPLGVLDRSSDGHPCGSASLLRAAHRARPRVHAFGHIHEGYGATRRNGTLFVNAAVCTLDYQPTNAPIVVDLDEHGVATVVAAEAAT